jgi:acyl-CoA synthetase (AMP-forming)/AMP-acid ligase II
MASPLSFPFRLRDHVRNRPDAPAFVFLRRQDDPGEILTWSGLWRSAAILANRLPLSADPGSTGVLIFCSDERNFVIGFLATWMRGAVAIPATGGFNAQLVDRNRHMFERARPDLVLHDLPASSAARLRQLAPDVTLICLNDQVSTDRHKEFAGNGAFGGLLQFTSGSTLAPKPVLLSNADIAANCEAITQTFSLNARSAVVHWLPLFHDMGLIGSVVTPVWTGCTSVILHPTIFIQRPVAWLEQISKWRATTTSAPNFAYEWLCNRLDATEIGGLDLSCLENVIFGGEPVVETTVNRLLQTLAPRGLRAAAIAPAYGMAEATLLISAYKSRNGPRFSTRHSATPAACLGPVVTPLSLTVRNSGGEETARGEPGEIWLDGDCIGHVLGDNEDWRTPRTKRPIRTGDFGFVEDGQVYVTGRQANRIIIRGRNICAEDVEALIQRSQSPGYAAGVVAFGVDGDGSQTLCVLVEPTRRDSVMDITALNQVLATTLGVKPARVITLRNGTLPRTSSGKIRRGFAREQFLAGAYGNRTISHVRQTAH